MMEVKRKVSKVVVTEDGLFHDGQLPADYSGAHIPVEVCHSIMFADEQGHFTTFTLYAPPAMNNTRSITPYDPSQMRTIVPPTSETFGSDSAYAHRLPADVQTTVAGHVTLIESDGASKAMP